MAKKTVHEEINMFIQEWDVDQIISFLKELIPIFQLYDVDEEDDWVEQAIGREGCSNVRLIRTVYLISKLAHLHAGKLCLVNVKFKDLWKRMDKIREMENAALKIQNRSV